ncbi:hypothetical protein [Bdellovibrio bacteriovorus]|uniref:hypothetical protein n=1 Tax=Bdellovibrio TaxID=958 RepID=UPI0035A93BD4
MTNVQDVIQFGIEATTYLKPDKNGLSSNEIHELCGRFGYQKGEINDGIDKLMKLGTVEAFFNDELFYLKPDYLYFMSPWFRFRTKEPRNLKLMHNIMTVLSDELKAQGRHGFSVSIPFLTTKIDDSLVRNQQDILVSLNLLARYKQFTINKDQIEKPGNMFAGDFVQKIGASDLHRNHEDLFAQVMDHVSEIIRRKESNRTIATDPLAAFEELFTTMECEKYLAWWKIQLLELNSIDQKRCCNLTIVSSAALCEGALSFFAASEIRQGLTMDKKLPDDPKQWKLSVLIDAASTGAKPLIDAPLRARLIDLNEHRKVIHPSYFMSGPMKHQKVPDIRPEQSEFAVETLKKLLRAIIEWVQVNRTIQA